MGIRTTCPNGHKLNVKAFLAGLQGICPHCGVSFRIPTQSDRSISKTEAGEVAISQAQTLETPTVAVSANQPQPRSVSRQPAYSGAAMKPPPLPIGGGDFAHPLTSGPMAAATPTADGRSATGQSPDSAIGSSPVAANDPIIGQPSATAPAEPATPSRPAESPMAPLSGFAMSVSTATAESAPPAPQPPAPQTQTPDPLAEAPDAVWYVRPASGGQFGPATNDIMRTWLKEGRIGPDSLVWREGWRDWKDAAATFPQFSTDPGDIAGILAASEPVPVHPAAAHHAPVHRRTDGAGILLISLLFLAVVVLVIVLCWVLLRQSGGSAVSAADNPPLAMTIVDGPARSFHERVA